MGVLLDAVSRPQGGDARGAGCPAAVAAPGRLGREGQGWLPRPAGSRSAPRAAPPPPPSASPTPDCAADPWIGPPRSRWPVTAQAQGRRRARAGPDMTAAPSPTPAPVHQQVPSARIPRHLTAHSSNIRPAVPRTSTGRRYRPEARDPPVGPAPLVMLLRSMVSGRHGQSTNQGLRHEAHLALAAVGAAFFATAAPAAAAEDAPSERELACLAEAVYHEARCEPTQAAPRSPMSY
jgi:hypothetical protein